VHHRATLATSHWFFERFCRLSIIEDHHSSIAECCTYFPQLLLRERKGRLKLGLKFGKELKRIPIKYAHICSGFFLTLSPTSPPYANFTSAKNDLQYYKKLRQAKWECYRSALVQWLGWVFETTKRKKKCKRASCVQQNKTKKCNKQHIPGPQYLRTWVVPFGICGSAVRFVPGVSGLPYYHTPLVCVPGAIGALAVWRPNIIKTNVQWMMAWILATYLIVFRFSFFSGTKYVQTRIHITLREHYKRVIWTSPIRRHLLTVAGV